MNSYVIDKYICDIHPKNLDTLDILTFKSCAESPLTGDIKMIFKLYKQIENYNKTFSHENSRESKVLLGISSSFLNHILRVIATLSDITKGQESNPLNDDLMRYSNMALHRLLSINKSYIDKKVRENTKIKSKIQKLEEDKTKLSDKVNEIQNFILKNMSGLSASEPQGQVSESASVSTSVGGAFQSSTSDMTGKVDHTVSTSTPLTFTPVHGSHTSSKKHSIGLGLDEQFNAVNGVRDLSDVYSEDLDYLSSNNEPSNTYDKDQIVDI